MAKALGTRLLHAAHDQLFKAVHSRWLIYNTCWEDPRIDRQLLALDGLSQVVMLTSAGCNALDYLLDGPARIHAVDVNPRQNALLQLKLALLRRGSWEDLFAMFGDGSHDAFRDIYAAVRHDLPDYAQGFWDDKIGYFAADNRKQSFYFHGTSGLFAWLMTRYLLNSRRRLRRQLLELLDAESLDEQRAIYRRIEPALWGRWTSWFVRQPAVMAMLGVPRAQIRLMETQYPGGVVGYVRDKFRHVLTEVLIRDNYFWRVYLTGSYTEQCCPNYLKRANFETLRANCDRITTYNTTVTEFLRSHPGRYSHFVLLDHQDWLAGHDPAALQEEWQLLLQNSVAGSKVMMRSAGAEVDFIPDTARGSVRFFPELTGALHRQDRVGTYGSLHLAEVV